MLIIPLVEKPSWKTLPAMTLLLFVINVFVFVFLQLPDGKINAEFGREYVKSPLGAKEFPQYAAWLEGKNQSHEAAFFQSAAKLSSKDVATLAVHLQSDREFLALLPERQKRALSVEEYAAWSAARAPLDTIWRKNFTERYLYVPALHRPVTWFTHMFMHGGFGHLIGNMIMLVLVGLLVEQAVGAWRTAALYLLGGLGSLVIEYPFHANLWVGSLGASGAIAALMGASAVLFGLRKIRFFYHVIFYFNFVTLPALVVLPVWIANEFWQWVTLRHKSNVAYWAHIGGLICGALIAWMFKRHAATRLEAIFPGGEPGAEDPIVTRERRAKQYLDKMNWDAALREYAALAEAKPQNTDYAAQVYRLSRTAPASDQYHNAARHFFAIALRQPALAAKLAETVNDYWKTAKPMPRLSVAQIVKLAQHLAKHSQYDTAENITQPLLRAGAGAGAGCVAGARAEDAKAASPELASLLLTLAVAFQRASTAHASNAANTSAEANRQKARRYVSALATRFPESQEARLAQQLVL